MYWRHSLNFDIDIDTFFDHEKLFVPVCVFYFLFWLSETCQIWGFWAFLIERIEEMAWNVARWCILATFRTD